MNRISITDITIKQSARGCAQTLSFREKIEIAKQLDRLGVNVIELHGIENARIDALLIKSIASSVKYSTLAVPVALTEEGPAAVWSALQAAQHARLQVAAPLSAVQMEYLAGKKPDAMLSAIERTVTECAALCHEVEFIADDATRAEPEFLAAALRRAIAAGACVVTICDTAGTMLPSEFGALIERIQDAVPELQSVRFGVSCCDELSMADACAVSAIWRGAQEIKTSADHAGAVGLESLVRILAAKSAELNAESSVQTTRLKSALEQIVRLCRASRSKTSPFDHGVLSGAEIYLTAHDNIEAVGKTAAALGYDLSEEDRTRVYEAFSRIAARKETVGVKELEAIIATEALQVPPTYRLGSYVINTGNLISATAHLRLLKNGKTMEGVCIGDGPIDAALLAIEQIVGRHYELDDFQIQAVTEGHEAMGETIVKLRSDGRLYAGCGISTDIVGASIHAYLNALNKIAYEESGS